MLKPGFSKKNCFHTQGTLQFPETQVYVFGHQWEPAVLALPLPYTPGPVAQQLPKAREQLVKGRVKVSHSTLKAEEAKGTGQRGTWQFSGHRYFFFFLWFKRLAPDILLLNSFFLTYFPVPKAENYRQGKPQMSGSKISLWVCGN